MTRKSTDTILKILEQTKEKDTLTILTDEERVMINRIRAVESHDGAYNLGREERIDLAMIAVNQGVDIAEVVNLLTWKDFEGLIAGILTENGFQCTESFRRRGTSTIGGMEIDVIGIRGRLGFSVDAKMWSIRGGKVTALRTAAEKQKQRTSRLVNQLTRLSQRIPLLKDGTYEFIPVIVTWLVEEVETHEGVPVVPVFKFNSFILNFEQYQDLMISYSGHIE